MDNPFSNRMPNAIAPILEEITRKLTRLEGIDVGYPIGQNMLRAPCKDDSLIFLKPDLCEQSSFSVFYELCDGVSLPDLGNGLFIHSRKQNLTSRSRGLPVRLKVGAAIFTFGSDGGGGLFAAHEMVDDCRILHLPVGTVINGEFDNTRYPISIVAPSFAQFLCRIVEDLDAFIDQRSGWKYIA
jgi:hypothetical protein